MLRLVIASLAVSLASATAPLRAQVATPADSIAPAPTASDTASRIVRVSADRLPFELRNLLGNDCGLSGGLKNITRYFGGPSCKPHSTGTLSRLGADSLVFVRNGRSIALSMRDVQKVEVRAGRSAWRTAAGGVFGGLAGMLGSLMIGIGGGYSDDDAFANTAIALTAGGAAIGAYRGGKSWRTLPRPEGAPPGPR